MKMKRKMTALRKTKKPYTKSATVPNFDKARLRAARKLIELQLPVAAWEQMEEEIGRGMLH